MKYLFNTIIIIFVSFNSFAQSINAEINYEYDQWGKVISEKTYNSDGTSTIKKKKYVTDYNLVCNLPQGVSPDNATQGIIKLAMLNIRNRVIEEYVYKLDANGSNPIVTDGVIYIYPPNTNNYKPYLSQIWKLKSEVPLSSFNESTVTTSCTFVKDMHYVLEEELVKYDNYGNLLSAKDKSGFFTSFKYDYLNNYLTCQVNNSEFSDFSHTSFETSNHSNFNFFDGNIVNTPSSLTGQKGYLLETQHHVSMALPNSSIGKSYILSFWCQSTASFPIVWMNNVNVPKTVSSNLADGWSYVECKFISNGGNLSIKGNNLIIDELRFHNSNATMKTMTYIPSVGITSVCNENNLINYFEYDEWNRQKIVRDQNKKILSKSEFKTLNND